jgi:hypothetical protein
LELIDDLSSWLTGLNPASFGGELDCEIDCELDGVTLFFPPRSGPHS